MSKLEAEKQEPVACWCHKCNENKTVNGLPFAMTRMILCPECGNKRCPKASDHALQCTNSNEPNQAGSVYTHPQPKREPLTDEQVDNVIEQTGIAIGHAHNAWDMVDQRELVRAVLKAAHGIKGEA